MSYFHMMLLEPCEDVNEKKEIVALVLIEASRDGNFKAPTERAGRKMLDLRKSSLHFSLGTMANQHGTKLIARKNLETIGMRKAYRTMTNGDRNRIFELGKVFPTFAVSPNSRSPHFCLSNLFT